MKLWNKLSHRSLGRPVQDYATVFQQQIEADRVFRGIPCTLEGFQAKFRCNLIGHWQTESNCDSITTTTWNFYADGTAQQLTTSMIKGDSELRFRWREKENFVIEICPASASDENANWHPIHYAFKVNSGQIVLCHLPESSTFKFYQTTDYPVFQGDHHL